jgi:hypothetical protein
MLYFLGDTHSGQTKTCTTGAVDRVTGKASFITFYRPCPMAAHPKLYQTYDLTCTRVDKLF